MIEERCNRQSGELTRLPAPDSVFTLSNIAHDAFLILGDGLAELDVEGLSAMDDDRAIQRYLRGVIAANNAMAEVSRTAGFEQLDALRDAVDGAEGAGDDLDAAAEALGLPHLCGARAWGGPLFAEAAEVADGEEEAMAPTDDLVEDVTTYCQRWNRSLRRAPEPGGPSADRAWAFSVGHAIGLLGDRLAGLDPPNAQQAAFDGLTEAVADTAEVLAPSETYAIDGEDEKLDALVEEAQGGVNRVNALLRSLSSRC